MLGRLFGRSRPTIELYRGLGGGDRLFVHGRVLEGERPVSAVHGASRWANLVAMMRRINAAPLAGAMVSVRAGSVPTTFTTDDEGFFSGWLSAAGAERVDDEWVRVHAELVARDQNGASSTVRGLALVPNVRPRLLVISDVDDTVLQSNVTSLFAAVRTLLFENARTRLPFPGVAAFYRALRAGASGHERNPIVYVSSSPWNLYDVIAEFLDIQKIPVGPLMLRDVDLHRRMFAPKQHHDHKRAMVRRVLEMFPDVPAILIGDSGQEDPEIYRDVVAEFPGRILAVYIRVVRADAARTNAMQALAAQVLAANSSLVIADDTMAAARHAAERGWIDPGALTAINMEKQADTGEVTRPANASSPPVDPQRDAAP